MRTILFRLLAALLLAAAAAPAQETAIRAGNLIDPATGSVERNRVIVVRNGKIVSVGSEVPAGAQVVDLSSEWVMPGLMDAHTHITMSLPPSPPGGSLWESQLLKESTGLRALRGIHEGEVLLRAGITTVRDLGNAANYADVAVRQGIEKGWFAGPTVVASGKILAPFGGQSHGYSAEHGRFWAFEYIDADTADEVRKGVRQNIYYGAQVIKLVTDNSAFHYSADELRAAVDEAHRAGIKVAVHVYGGAAADEVIAAGVDSIEHGFALNEAQLQRMKERNIVLVGTDFPYEHIATWGDMVGPVNPRELAAQIVERLRLANQVGTRMAFGSDVVNDLAGKSRADMTFDYLKVWREAGVPPAAILKAMTTNCAELLGLAKQRGAIATGQAADIIAMPASPLENVESLRRVNFVMKDGKVIRRP